MKRLSLSLVIAAGAVSHMAAPAQALGYKKCRQYVNVPISMAISSGRAAALFYGRFYDHNRFRGRMGPHHYARLLHPVRKCPGKRSRKRPLK